MHVSMSQHSHLPLIEPQTSSSSNNNINNSSSSIAGSCLMSTTQLESPSQVMRSCAGCGRRIADRYLLKALDNYWHTQCLKCCCCQVNLAEVGHSCFTKRGMILCKQDYFKIFGATGTCSGCMQQIPADEMVLRTQTAVYHVKCFTCVQCNAQLNPGDKYSFINGSLFCEHEFPKLFGASSNDPSSSPPSTVPVINNNNNNNNNSSSNNNNTNHRTNKTKKVATGVVASNTTTASATSTTPNTAHYLLPVC